MMAQCFYSISEPSSGNMVHCKHRDLACLQCFMFRDDGPEIDFQYVRIFLVQSFIDKL